MKIVDFKSYKEYVQKLDGMTQDDPSKIKIDFHYSDNSVSEKMKRFFDVADGNPEWNV